MGYSGRRDVRKPLGPKKVFGQLTDIILIESRGLFIYVSRIVQVCHECNIVEESRRRVEASIISVKHWLM